MVLPDYSIKMLETNLTPGLADFRYQSEFFEGVIQRTVDVIIPPTNKIEIDNNWTNIFKT